MSTLVTLALIVPLAAASITLMAWHNVRVQRIAGIASSVALMAISIRLIPAADDGGAVVARIGGWDAPLGISLVADRLAVIVLLTASVALLAVLLYSISQGTSDTEFGGFHAVYQMLAAGVALATLTGDLFTLFVAFEMMLTASYVLLTHRAGTSETRATLSYVVIGLVASALLLTAIAVTYAITGTVNMADLTVRLDTVPSGVRAGLGWLFFLVFGIKAAIFPLFFWLPDSYPTAPTPVTALFAGLLTKLGIYAILRTQTLLFPNDRPVTGMLIIAGFTMVVGALGAIAQKDIKRILSFHIVSQIGYIVMGLGFFTVAGVAAAILFLVHQIIVKASLFLVGGLVEDSEGTGAIDDVGGVLHRSPLIAVLFLPAALSLAGFPPFSGFAGKLALATAGFDAGSWAIVGVSLGASILTLFSMTKIWGGVFWGAPRHESPRPLAPMMLWSTASLVIAGVAIGLFAEPLLGYVQRAATDLLEQGVYRSWVFGVGA